MPVMDGLDLCRHIRADATTRDIVVVAVTGDGPTHIQNALAAGCDVVLEKPISRTVLLTTIRVLLERR
jgi:CheY-like chemotaxis protein